MRRQTAGKQADGRPGEDLQPAIAVTDVELFVHPEHVFIH